MPENKNASRASNTAAASPAPEVAGKADRLAGKMASIRVWIAIAGLVLFGLVAAFMAYKITFGKQSTATEAPAGTRKKSGTVYAIIAALAFGLAFVFYRYRTSETLAALLFVSNVMN